FVSRADTDTGPFYLTGASSVAGAAVRCTFDGSEPNPLSGLCWRPVPIDHSVTVKAKAFQAGWDPSPTTSQDFQVTGPVVGTPIIGLASGRYSSRRRVAIEDPMSGAVVHYTTSGADPTESDAEVPVDGVLVDRSMVLKARAFDGSSQSLVARAEYELTGAVDARTTVVVLKADGSVWAWGDNRYNQAGDGAQPSQLVPRMLPIDSVVAVASGYYHSLALRED